MPLGGFYKGFIDGCQQSTTFFAPYSLTENASSNWQICDNYRCTCIVVTPGNPGNPASNPPTCVCFSPSPGNPVAAGGAGGTSTFNGAGTANYPRKTSQLVPRQVVPFVVGGAGPGGCGGMGTNPGNPGTAGNVKITIK